MSSHSGRNPKITIKDVAELAGVSYSTVSRVMNAYEHVRPDKRKRVIEAMTRLGYVANPSARTLASGRSNTIGLLVPDLLYSYTGVVVRGIDEALSAHQYDLMLYTHHQRKTKESTYVKTLSQGMTDGLLLLLPADPSAYLVSLREMGFPYVVIDHQGFDDFSPTVVASNAKGAYDATAYLLDLGHTRIGFVAGATHTSSATERENGYRNALIDHGVTPDDALIVPGNFMHHEGYLAAVKLLDLPEPPTAIFAANDVMAFGVIDAARERGMRIPQDLSVIGFGDIPQAAWMTPALTTVRQPLEAMGKKAVKMLLERIEKPNLPVERMMMATELVVRDTCQRRTG